MKRTGTGILRALALALVFTVIGSVTACSRADMEAYISIEGSHIDLSADFKEVIGSFYEQGLTPFDMYKKKVIAEDGSTLLKYDRNAAGKMAVAARNVFGAKGQDVSDYMGYCIYGFNHVAEGDVSVPGGPEESHADVSSLEEALKAGFVQTPYYAVKLYADGREVDIEKYREPAADYCAAFMSGESDSDYFVESGCISDSADCGAYLSGYGLVSEIRWESYSTLKAYLQNSEYADSMTSASGNIESENVDMFNTFMIKLAACDLGQQYMNGRIRSLTAVMVPTREIDYFFVCVACRGDEVED